jgi:CBS domain containing-hemolysin-like protein
LLSKTLIYEGSIDHIIGFTHSYEMFRNPVDIRSILLPISMVPETMAANDLLALFTRQHKSIALVLNEFGSTAGMVTLEDVLEEIFGEIEDEHDVDDLVEKQLNEHEFIFSGRTEVDYINAKYHVGLPVSDGYETLAGLIFHHYERIPQYNDVIRIENFVITVLSVSNTRIERVKVKKEE